MEKTAQPSPGPSRPKLRVDSATAALVRRLAELEPGRQAVIVYTVDADGRRSWELGIVER